MNTAIHPGVRIGHVHLKVADLERALAFYCGVLGFQITQRYGTQVRCTPFGAQPATPLVDPEGVDDLRAEVGLDPLASYLAEFEDGCAEEIQQTEPTEPTG